MKVDNPRALIAEVRLSGRALAAFNVNNMETIQAVLAAAEGAESPVMLQVSPGAIEYAGYEAITTLAFSEASRASVPVFVHLDHCRDADLVHRAIDDGFTSVMFDGSALPVERNVEITQQVVVAAHSVGVAVEAELGTIGGSESMTLEEARASVTTPAEARDFVAATGVDILAPAIGTLHRMPNDSVALDLSLITSLAEATDRPLALHGGSGVQRKLLTALIRAGITKVNISSRVGRAFADGILTTWESEPEQRDLRRYLGAGRRQVELVAGEYLALCGWKGTADRRAEWSGAAREVE